MSFSPAKVFTVDAEQSQPAFKIASQSQRSGLIRNQLWLLPLSSVAGTSPLLFVKKVEKMNFKVYLEDVLEKVWSPGAARSSRTSRSSFSTFRRLLSNRRSCRSGVATSFPTLPSQKNGLLIAPTSTIWTSLGDSRLLWKTSVDWLKQNPLKAWEETSMECVRVMPDAFPHRGVIFI